MSKERFESAKFGGKNLWQQGSGRKGGWSLKTPTCSLNQRHLVVSKFQVCVRSIFLQDFQALLSLYQAESWRYHRAHDRLLLFRSQGLNHPFLFGILPPAF